MLHLRGKCLDARADWQQKTVSEPTRADAVLKLALAFNEGIIKAACRK